MTPKDKALGLIKRYRIELYDMDNTYAAKQCALVCINEILYDMKIRLGLDKEDYEYWEEVKQEINKL